MKQPLLALAMMCAMTNPAYSQSRSMELKDGWVFSRGDETAWSATDFDDGAWGPIKVGISWTQAGHPDYHGLGWYRLRVRPEGAWKKDPLLSKSGFLILDLGKIDDCDETFWNGEKIGGMGKFPPSYETAWNDRRRYKIPLDKILWDKDNLLAVRVYDGGGGAGITPLPVSLSLPGLDDFVEAQISLGRGDGIFPGGSPMGLYLDVKNGYHEALKGKLLCHVATDSGDEIDSFETPVSSPPGVEMAFVFDFQPPAPGFYRVSFRMELQKGLKLERSMILGYDPERMDIPLTREKDFQEFWDEARKELASVKPEFKVEKQEKLSEGEKDIYLVTMRSLGKARVRAWYSVPKGDGIWPAVLQVPGHSSSMQPDQGALDIAVLSLDIRGHGNSKDDVNPGFPGYLTSGLESEKTYIYRGAYMDCLRAVDFLMTRSEIDKKRIGVEGGSQGGALSFAAAALDPRIIFAAPDVPFLSDFRDYAKVAGWPTNEFVDYGKNHPDLGVEGVHRVLSYFDIMNLAPWIKVPIIMSVGLQDPTCPPRINFAAYNRVSSPKEYYVYPHGDHGGGGGIHWAIKYAWVRDEFGLTQK